MAVYREIDDDLVAQGVWGEVRHAIRTSGEMEAKDWLEDENNAAAVAKFDHLFRKVCAGQRITNEQHFRHLSKQIWEFKRDANRLLCFSRRAMLAVDTPLPEEIAEVFSQANRAC